MKTQMEVRQKRSKKDKQNKKEKIEIKIEENSSVSNIKSEPGKSLSKSTLGQVTEFIKNKRALISDNISEDPVFKKSKDNYSVAEDPQATDVYKSLFTSHSSDKSQERAHWVTYNPFYN